jgi:hypothetical protein
MQKELSTKMSRDPYAYVKQPRLVYGYFDITGQIVYIGSSHLTLEKLEYNHRNAFTLWPKEAKKQKRFRVMLRDVEPDRGEFRRLLELDCTRPVIEAFEGQMIRAFKPFYNDDIDPVASSKFYERY